MLSDNGGRKGGSCDEEGLDDRGEGEVGDDVYDAKVAIVDRPVDRGCEACSQAYDYPALYRPDTTGPPLGRRRPPAVHPTGECASQPPSG